MYLAWNKMICILCLLSSFYFISCCANIHLLYDDKWENVVCETLFLLDFITKFFLSFQDPKNQSNTVYDLEQIVTNYLNGDFLKELIPLFPFYLFKWKRNRQNYFYIIKLIRVERGITFLNNQQQSNIFKDYQNMHLR